MAPSLPPTSMSALTQAAPLDCPVPPSATDVDTLFQQAMQAHRAGSVASARLLYEQVLERAPDHADALHLYGVLEGLLQNNERALELILRAVAINPLEPMFHNNLGNVYSSLDRLDAAEAHYRRTIELDPGRYDAINNLAVLLGRRGDLQGAEQSFRALLEVAPGFANARQNLANILLRSGRLHEAVHQCMIGLVTEPRNPGMRHMLGSAYGMLGLREQAIELYRKWLEHEPSSAEAAHHLAAYTGVAVPERASPAYLRATFDTFASNFDDKLAQVDYRGPTLIGEAVAAALGEPERSLRVADAGCGTGLCAAGVAPYAARLVGVDLSPPMLQRAAARGLYDELVESELTAFLDARPAAFDLLVAADTLCYFGSLEGFAAAAHRSLGAGGLLVFTVEALEAVEPGAGAPGWRLQTHGRYSHRKNYLVATLVGAGFAKPEIGSEILRQEAGKPVAGWLVQAEKH